MEGFYFVHIQTVPDRVLSAVLCLRVLLINNRVVGWQNRCPAAIGRRPDWQRNVHCVLSSVARIVTHFVGR